MTNKNSDSTRTLNYIKETFPWLHGHQSKALTAIVEAVLEKQTGNQAELARTQETKEAGCKRFSRLIHNDKIDPRKLTGFVSRLFCRFRKRGKSAFPLTGPLKANNTC